MYILTFIKLENVFTGSLMCAIINIIRIKHIYIINKFRNILIDLDEIMYYCILNKHIYIKLNNFHVCIYYLFYNIFIYLALLISQEIQI